MVSSCTIIFRVWFDAYNSAVWWNDRRRKKKVYRCEVGNALSGVASEEGVDTRGAASAEGVDTGGWPTGHGWMNLWRWPKVVVERLPKAPSVGRCVFIRWSSSLLHRLSLYLPCCSCLLFYFCLFIFYLVFFFFQTLLHDREGPSSRLYSPPPLLPDPPSFSIMFFLAFYSPNFL